MLQTNVRAEKVFDVSVGSLFMVQIVFRRITTNESYCFINMNVIFKTDLQC